MPHPKIDPYGSPIPDGNVKMEWEEYIKLSDCKPIDRFPLQAIMKSEDELLAYLSKRELKLWFTFKVLSVEPFDGSMSVSYGQRPDEIFSRTVCERLLGNRLE